MDRHPRDEDRYYICSDDEGVLLLSTDESVEHKRPVAHEPEWNPSRLWVLPHGRPKQENVSEPIRLEAGRHYYVEALMKEGKVLDNLAVTWQLPGEPPPENLAPPIPGAYLAVPDEWPKAATTPLVSGRKDLARP